MTELMVLIDTLSGSLSISDGGRLFNYHKETRSKLWEALHNRSNELLITVGDENIPSENNNITHKWNFEQRDDGLYFCRGLHNKNESCEWELITESIIREIIQSNNI